jgi:hypothetical protein
MNAASLIAFFVTLSGPALATVTMEFQLGGVQVPAGSVGALVADTGSAGFASPFTSGGTTLAPGSKIGADDTIVAIFDPSNLDDFTSGEGFAAILTGVDYAALGVSENQPLIFYIFPERNSGDSLRAGEPHVAYTTTDITPNSTMGFSLPRDGGSYLLAALGSELGGSADLAPVDISSFDHTAIGSPLNRSLTESAEHSYYFDVTSAGLLKITGSGGAGLHAELYGPNGELITSSDGTGGFTFQEDLGPGFHTLVVFRDSGGPTSLAYSLQVTDADGGVVIPDVSVGPNPAAPIGNGAYASAGGQVSSLNSLKARAVNGFARVGNDGDLAEVLAVRGNAGNGFCKISYLGSSGNVTGAIVSGTFQTPQLTGSDDPVALTIQFIPDKKKLIKDRGRRTTTVRRLFSSTLRATSTTVTADADTAHVRVQTR